ncbi:MAG: 1-acyl-sn-glycerol-3-phosphate acyltransferase [Myxococcota bacterium]
MRRHFGLLYHLSGIGLLLSRIRIEDHSADEIRRAMERGPVVYILHTRSTLDWLAFNRALNSRGFPLPRFTNGLRSTVWAPIGTAISEWWGAIRDRAQVGPNHHPITSGWLTNVVAAGMPSALFLLAGRNFRSTIRRERDRPKDFDPVPALLDAQAKCDQPIQLVPVVIAWQRRPEVARSQVGRFILGSEDEPGPLQKLLNVATRDTKVVAQAGAPIDLAEMIAQFSEDEDKQRIRRIRLLLRRYLWRESHLIRGPRVRAHRWTQRLVTQSPEIRELVKQQVAETGKSRAEVTAEVEKVLRHIAARMQYRYIQLAAWILKILWNRIYAGVDLPDEDMKRLRDSFRDATPVIIPCHRSHLDYLLMSSQLYYRDVVIPHIVAGENLSFFPLGYFFRRCGAFFIKRSFGQDKIFPTVFQRYLHQLVRDGFPIEFFIEGGRSRTGKLLPPRLGVLKMIMDSAVNLREGWDVNLVPVAISYEQVAEESSYRNELGGTDKKPESATEVVKAARIFGRTFGRVYVRIGEPIRLSQVFGTLDRPWQEMNSDHKMEAVQMTGERVMHRISQQMMMLPTGLVAMALLAQSRRGIHTRDLNARINRLYKALRMTGAQVTRGNGEKARGIAEALKRFEDGKLIQRLTLDNEEIIQVVDDRRVTLEYSKNGILHFLTPMSLMAAAFRACRNDFSDNVTIQHHSPTMEEVRRLFAEQVFLLRYEFTLDPEQSVDELEGGAIDQLVAYGAISNEDGLRIVDRERMVELAELTRNFLESTSLTLRGARALRSRDLNKNSMTKALQEIGKQLLSVDELMRPEALSTVNLNNTVRAFREEGVISFRTDGTGLELDEELLSAHEADLNQLLS